MTILKLDYDKITTRDIQLIFHHRGWFLKSLGILSVGAWQTTKGYHVLVAVETYLKPEHVILAQILMGSDINRDIYNFLREIDGQLMKVWNKLYTKKYIILGAKIGEELSGEVPCPELLERIIHELDESQDVRDQI